MKLFTSFFLGFWETITSCNEVDLHTKRVFFCWFFVWREKRAFMLIFFVHLWIKLLVLSRKDVSVQVIIITEICLSLNNNKIVRRF